MRSIPSVLALLLFLGYAGPTRATTSADRLSSSLNSKTELAAYGGNLFGWLRSIGLYIKMRPRPIQKTKQLLFAYDPVKSTVTMPPFRRDDKQIRDYLNRYVEHLTGRKLAPNLLPSGSEIGDLYRTHHLFWLTRALILHAWNVAGIHQRVGGFVRESTASRMAIVSLNKLAADNSSFAKLWKSYRDFFTEIHGYLPATTRKAKWFDEEAQWNLNGRALGRIRYNGLILRDIHRSMKLPGKDPAKLFRRLVRDPARWLHKKTFKREAVIKGLESPEASRRCAAAVALFLYGADKAVKKLVKLAKSDPSHLTRITAIATLLRHPSAEALEAYNACLRPYVGRLASKCRQLIKQYGTKK